MKSPARTRDVLRAALLALLLAAGRLTMLVEGADVSARGDFFATLPGAYVEPLNPTLWNSNDLQTSWGFQRRFYYYGPTQYLTLYPIAFLSSYRQIAIVLSLVYAAVLTGALCLISRLIRPENRGLLPGVVALALLFAPLLQAYIHVEFEVVVFFAVVAATYLLAKRRDAWAGALLGYVAWFKMWPMVFLGYFLAKRQFRAVRGFVLASVLVLGAAHVAFGLDRFVVLNPALARSIPGREFFLKTLLTPTEPSFDAPLDPNDATGQGFCNGWVRSNETSVSARWGMCGLMFAHHWPSGVFVFYAGCLAAAFLYVVGFLRAERSGELSPADRTARLVCEISLLVIGAALTLVAHFYYMIFLIVPIIVLFYRYVERRAWIRLGWLASAYAVLGGLIVPVWLASRAAGKNFWGFYAGHSVYLYGLVLLSSLILWEYISLGSAKQRCGR